LKKTQHQPRKALLIFIIIIVEDTSAPLSASTSNDEIKKLPSSSSSFFSYLKKHIIIIIIIFCALLGEVLCGAAYIHTYVQSYIYNCYFSSSSYLFMALIEKTKKRAKTD
jgi:phage-related holin